MLSFLINLLLFGFIATLILPILFLMLVLCQDKGRRSFVLAVRSLWLHKLRAFLSVLGIIIGTAAVIVLMAFGEGSMQDALEDIKRQGATNIIIRSVKLPTGSAAGRRTPVAVYGIKESDYGMFLTLNTVVRHVRMRTFRQDVRFREKMETGRLVGTDATYAEVNGLEFIQGRFFTEDECKYPKNRVVLGYAMAQALFPYSNPIGESVSLGRLLDKFQVVGVVANRHAVGGNGDTQEEFNQDVYVPLPTVNRWYGANFVDRQSGQFSAERVELHQVTLTVGDIEQVRPTGEAVRHILEREHGEKKDWEVYVPLDKLEEAERTKNRYTMMLVMIGGISLVVGGIGIMNIMLATVTERTREIGIRRALGAKRRDITLQFLVEAIVQTGVGGIVGVVLGLTLMFTIPLVAFHLFDKNLPAQIHKYSIFLSLGVSVCVGVGFGWYPARRAALLDPIEALRHE